MLGTDVTVCVWYCVFGTDVTVCLVFGTDVTVCIGTDVTDVCLVLMLLCVWY